MKCLKLTIIYRKTCNIRTVRYSNTCSRVFDIANINRCYI
nr:MAG TPA: hypothetical protein [Caudoviricetes sp.]